jgi:hypothetical protein
MTFEKIAPIKCSFCQTILIDIKCIKSPKDEKIIICENCVRRIKNILVYDKKEE